MATKNLALRLVAQAANDTGDSASNTFDETLTLDSYTDITPARRIALAVDADDQPVVLTNAIQVLVYSHDYPFSLRLAADETLLSNLRLFVVTADDEDDGIFTTSFLLTGNGSNVADIEVWIVEKPA